MECPHCAEEIQDAATACRYCGRDLSLVLSLMRDNEQLQEKISALESQIAQLSASPDAPPKETQAIHGERLTELSADADDEPDTSKIRWRQLALPVLIGGLLPQLCLFAFGVLYPSLRVGEGVLLWWTVFLIAFFPLVGGTWAGLKLHGRYLRGCALLGLTVLLASSTVLTAIFTVGSLMPGLNVLETIARVLFLSLLQTFMFTLGTLAPLFWRRAKLSERLLAAETKRGRITLAVVVPPLLWFSTYLVPSSPPQSASALETVAILCLLFVLMLVLLSAPLLSGLLAGLGWPERHLTGYILLGLAAGALANIGDVALAYLFGSAEFSLSFTPAHIHAPALSERLDPTITGVVPNTLSIVLFFIAGGLFADLLKSRSNPHLASEHGFAQQVATKLSGPGKKPTRKMFYACRPYSQPLLLSLALFQRL